MHTVVTINLNGRAYQLDEPAFALLRTYLDHATACLQNNPDRAEILADLEQAIAEKCHRFLHPHKTVVSAAEMDQVIKEMGPVESADGQPTSTAAPSPAGEEPEAGRTGPKRFYRIRDGAMFAGVCNGAAAYIHVDVVFVRIAVFVLTLVTHGWALLVYGLLAFAVPEAVTADEHAAAHGQTPFNAQDMIDEAKRAGASFAASTSSTRHAWRSQLRAQRRQWRSQARAWRRQWRATAADSRYWAGGLPPLDRLPRIGAMNPVAGFVGFVLFAALVVTLLSVFTNRVDIVWPGQDDLPVWASVLLIALLFHVVTSPLRMARYASRHPWGHRYGWFAPWEGLLGTLLLAGGLWLLIRHMPPVHDLGDFVDGLPDAIRGAAHEIGEWFRSVGDALRRDT